MNHMSRILFAGSALLCVTSVAVLNTASAQDKKEKRDAKDSTDTPAIESRWEILAGGGLYFIDRKSGEMWVYSHPGDVTLKPKPKYLGRMTQVGKELD